ncbi:exodeoxyribonuclease VII small subunit [Ligilactobacillus ruminis DSM 20403 = NBRC 102161]|jgi:exodeoxyribonuclease VII small subunit|uniref:Exodeoxyribonuclease 7 small subunit n=5 Tax=Ligilactobacillus ruminis TaxID=1623 RepID=F7QYA1_9LACO|nr:exodeoxyribonuclease VII, small subunit [Ligilactobacillus ruminis ATCC 25644]EGM53251.1 exodeoxyribonuclease VII small subunit [Ligilactobacillus ruminis SPM0211]KIC05604.1 exodeoxyribonuclease VII small subunit [Ligilactobacillus ruminis DPC 6832]KLA47130.1 exodeoxyribonuclease VII small subunit [Ligilactobacillus ruminis]KRM81854.1 exodeoxyribonuclease VII small subunit [Ligilactobacillus ruminis DSM 20403 = NBRC 102161]HCI89637.1 exodeoxyribonuclease VII small subunit [Lactobacillus sp.
MRQMNNEKTFEQQLQELEQIVNNLEKGNVPLEEAMAQFKEGIDLSNTLQKTLNDAEETLTKVINSNGEEEIYERADDNE